MKNTYSAFGAKAPLLAIGLTILISSVCWSQSEKLSLASVTERVHPRFRQLAPNEATDVIVIHRANAPKGAGPRIAARTGIRLSKHFENVRQSFAHLTEAEIYALAGDPEVEYVAPNSAIKALALDYGAQSVGAYAAMAAGFTGNGVGVAVIDSGISYLNSDYSYNSANRYQGQISFVTNLNGNWTAPDDGEDYFGHGSHVASILAGSGYFSNASVVDSWGIYPTYWIHGVATGVNVISERVLDKTGAGTDAMVIAAIDWAIANKSSANIRVINLSLGRPVTTSYTKDPLCQAAEAAWNAGIVVVAAAGNLGRQGYGTITAPGNDPKVITVGAVNTRNTPVITDDVVASYSSKGPTYIDEIVKPDIVAPGNQIIGTQCYMPGPASGPIVDCPLVTENPANMVPDTDYATTGNTPTNMWYFKLSGTSMATPMVSGAAALLIGKNPNLTPDQVKAILMATATKSNFVPWYVASEVYRSSRHFHDRIGRAEYHGRSGVDAQPAVQQPVGGLTERYL